MHGKPIAKSTSTSIIEVSLIDFDLEVEDRSVAHCFTMGASGMFAPPDVPKFVMAAAVDSLGSIEVALVAATLVALFVGAGAYRSRPVIGVA